MFVLVGCEDINSREAEVPNTENLQKLCKVWGFAKYTHKSFLLGQSDWDEELLRLVPLVDSATKDKTNKILYDWFAGLGNYGFDSLGGASAPDEVEGLRYMADMGWLTEEYLGEPLYAALSSFTEIPDIFRSAAPVSFDQMNNSQHSNEKLYVGMDFSDNGYRLLGLFRLWNAMEYYYPYIDVLDDDWSELLLEHIPMMLKGTDKQSYVETLVSLASYLDDTHMYFVGVTTPKKTND